MTGVLGHDSALLRLYWAGLKLISLYMSRLLYVRNRAFVNTVKMQYAQTNISLFFLLPCSLADNSSSVLITFNRQAATFHV